MSKSIVFTREMAVAVHEGRKTQTRRVLAQPASNRIRDAAQIDDVWAWQNGHDGSLEGRIKITYAVGDVLAVREPYWQRGEWQGIPGELTKGGKQKTRFVPDPDPETSQPRFRPVMACAPRDCWGWHKRLGRFMPGKYSRTTIKITDVRVQRVADISGPDCFSEGVLPSLEYDNAGPCGYGLVVPVFRNLWDSINDPRGYGWQSNPWVVAYTFEVVK